MAKDGWNQEVTALARGEMERDWRRTVEWCEGMVMGVWRGTRGWMREREEQSKGS